MLVNYLVHSQSAYTLADLKAYKSLQAYNYFISGFVQDLGHVVVGGKSVFLAKVKHSQRMNESSLKPWILTETDGSVISGHCICMAGVGEVCSHVGALLFAVEAAVKIRNTKTPTEDKAYWLLPSSITKVTYKTVQEIDFTSARTKKKQLDDAIATIGPVKGLKQRKFPEVHEPTQDELSSLFASLHATGKKPAILSLVPGYAENYKPKALSVKYPKVLTELYDEAHATDSPSTLKKYAETVFQDLKVSDEEASNCELSTRNQSKCKEWYSFRTGRLTASKMKAICKTSLDNPSKSSIKTICYPVKFKSKATVWGCEHEDKARRQYLTEMMKSHTNFDIEDSGFVIDPKFPFIGASPDGIASCDCCGQVVIEIKCPYCKRASDIDESLEYLIRKNNKLTLSNSHTYYYQVQCQLLVTGKQFCDFVVWTESDLFVERIEINIGFCESIVEKAEKFFKIAILPELIGKLYSRPDRDETTSYRPALVCQKATLPAAKNSGKEIICICRKVYDAESDDVIGCDGENCPYIWLHFKCAGIKRIPKGKQCRPDKKTIM